MPGSGGSGPQGAPLPSLRRRHPAQLRVFPGDNHPTGPLFFLGGFAPAAAPDPDTTAAVRYAQMDAVACEAELGRRAIATTPAAEEKTPAK